MKLCEFFKTTKLNKSSIAKNIKITYQALNNYMIGKRIPEKSKMRNIFIFSNGQVQPNDFFPISEWKQELKELKTKKEVIL